MKKLLLFSLFALLASAMSWAATETWTKVTSQGDLTDGDYLIVYEETRVAFNGSLSSTKLNTKPNDGQKVEIVNNSIETGNETTTCDFYFTIAKSGNNYTIKSCSGSYIGKSNNKSGMDIKTTAQNNTISIKDGVASINGAGGAALLYNKNWTGFRYYANSNVGNSGYGNITLYKKSEGPAPQPTQVAAPTFSIKDGSKVGYGTEVTVSSAEGTNLFVSYGDVKDENVGANTKTITLPTEGETYTISAYAVDPAGTLKQSETVTATYTLLSLSNKVANIKEFLDKADTENAMVFTNPVTVIGQYTTKQGTDLYVKDNTGSLLIYNPGITGLVNGDVIEAGFSGVYQLYNSLPELTKPENLVKSATAGTPVEPTVVTIDELAAAYYSEYVSLKKVKYDGSNFVDLNDETKTIQAYNKYKLVTLTAGKVYNVTGIYSIFNKVQILPLTAEELQYVADVTVSPAFGDIAKGTVVTISCATKGAVLNGTIGSATLEGQALPYTFTASEVGKIEVGVRATKEGLEDSKVLTGTYNVCQPKVAALEINPGFGTIEVGTVVTISCATEGAVLNGMIGDTDVTNAPLPYTFTAEKEGEISVLLSATKDGYDESEVLDNKFIVKAAVPVAYSDVITADDYKGTSSYTELNLKKNGATYSSKAFLKGDYLQFHNNDKKAGIVMKESKAFVSKIIITWNESGKGFEIYGKNSPYDAAVDLYKDNTKGTLLGTYAWTKKGDVTEIDLKGKPFTFIGVKPTGLTYINSIEFIWNESEAGNADVTYTKASEATAGNFAVLATADGKAVGRNADLNPVAVTVSGDAIGLAKGQTAIDEFEIIENGNNYQLYGGLASNGSRRYLTYDATGVTTVATADDNANVTFESKTAEGLLVKFNDGQYLMFNGTKFIKADYGEAVVQADGETLTPVIVFMSSSNVSTGVETVEFDENAEAQYFNLNGVQVKAENLTPGLYIVRQGNKVSKQVIR